MDTLQFDYRTEPFRTPLLVAAILVIVAIVVPVGLIRIVLLATAAGPSAWSLLQWRRQGRGVRLEADGLVIQPSLVGRTQRLPYAVIQNYMISTKGQFVVAFRKPDKVATVNYSPQSLTEIRPESHRTGPRYGLSVTPAMSSTDALLAALDARVAQPADQPFGPDHLKAWYRRRRMRNIFLVLLAILATPIYVVVIGRTIGSIIALGVNSSGR